jgi:AraC family cel operon transcriptional repressor
MKKLYIKNFIHKDQHFHWQSTLYSDTNTPHPHSHDFHELFYVDEGFGWHWVNKERRELRPGMLILIRSTDAHAFSAEDGKSFRMVNVAFRVETWAYLRRRYFLKRADYFGNSLISAREFHVPPAEFAELSRMGRELGVLPRDRLSIERFLLNAVALIENLRPVSAPRAMPEWLQKACREISVGRNFEHGTLAFARLAEKSPEHVAREVRRWLGKTPTELVNDARLAYAATRLATSQERIIDIAFDCGFENLSHFYKLMRKKLGVSPRRYRLMQQRIVRPT